jgi:hypothetical protein
VRGRVIAGKTAMLRPRIFCVHILIHDTMTAATKYPIVLAPDDDDECGAIGIMLGSGNRSTRRKPAQVPLCPP